MKPLILLVEDNKQLLEVLADELSEQYEILKALHGQQALNLLSNESIRLVISDVMMPVMDGFEFVEAFRKLSFPNQDKIVIVMLTTSSNPKDLDKVDALGIGGYINKPLTEEKLKNALSRNFK